MKKGSKAVHPEEAHPAMKGTKDMEARTSGRSFSCFAVGALVAGCEAFFKLFSVVEFASLREAAALVRFSFSPLTGGRLSPKHKVLDPGLNGSSKTYPYPRFLARGRKSSIWGL